MALKLSNIESAIAIIVSEVSAGKIKGFNFDGKELYQKIKSELMDSTKKDITYEHLYKLFENQYHIYKGTDDKNDKNKDKIPSIFLNICNLFKLINPISEHIYLEQSERQLLYKHIHFLKNLPSQVSEIIIIFLKVFNRFNDANLDEASNLFCNMKTSDDLIQAFINLIALSDIEINSLEENNLTVFKKILEHSTWASEEESNFFKNSFYQLIQCSDLLSKNKCLSTENISTLYDYIKGKNGSSDLRLEYTRLLVEANEFNAINLADCAAIESEESPEFILNIIKKLKGITSAKFTLDIILDALVNPFSRGKVSAFIDFISKISSHKILDQNDIKCLYRNIDILIDAKDFAPEVSVLSLKSWGQLNDHNLSKFLVLTSSEDNVVIADNIIAMINQWRLESNCEYIGSNNIVGDFKSLSNSHGKLYCNVLLYEIANIFRFANLLYSYNILTSEKIDLLLRYIKGDKYLSGYKLSIIRLLITTNNFTNENLSKLLELPKIKKIFDESGKLIDEINSDEKILDNAYSINNIIHTLELRGLSNQSILDILFAFAVEDKQCDIDYIALSSLIDGLLVMPSSYTIYGDIKELSTKNNLNDTNIKLLFYIYQLGIANDKKPTIQKKFEDNPNFKASLNILSKSKIFSKPNIERLDEKSAYISEGIIKALSALNEAEILDQLNFDRVISCCSQESLAKRYLDTYMAQRKVVHLEQNTFDILMLFASANITECEEVCGALGGKSINQDILKILSTLNLAGILPNLVSLILSELEFFDASLASIVTILKENGILTAKLFEYFLYKDLPSRKNILGVINKLSEFSLLEDFNLEEKLAAVFKEDSVWYGADITSSPFLLLKYFLGAGQLTLTNFERISDNFAFITSDLVDLFSILPDKVNFKAYFIKSFNLNKEVIDNIKNLVEPLSKADILHNVSFEFIKNKCNDSEFISAIHALCRNNCLTYEAFSRIANNNGLTKIVIGLDKAKLLNSDSFDKLFTLGENINFSLKLLLNKLIEKDSLTSKNYSYLINFSSVLTTSLSEVICRDIDNFFVQNSKASIIDFETFFAKAVPYEVLVELQDEILYVEAKKNEFKNWHASKRGGIDLLVQGNPNCSIKKNAHITHTESLVLKQIALAKENDKPEQLENHWLLAFVEVKRLFKEAKNSNGTWCSWFKGRKKETEEFYSEKDSKFSSVDVETMFNVGARLRA